MRESDEPWDTLVLRWNTACPSRPDTPPGLLASWPALSNNNEGGRGVLVKVLRGGVRGGKGVCEGVYERGVVRGVQILPLGY